ncbi:hypothetical protein D9M68_854710 [compost metagenome]
MGAESGKGEADGGGQNVALRKPGCCGLMIHERSPRLSGERLYLGMIINKSHPMQDRKCPRRQQKEPTAKAVMHKGYRALVLFCGGEFIR